MNARSLQRAICALALFQSIPAPLVAAEPPARKDWSREKARSSRDWVKDGVIYEIFPRAFSARGDFNGVTSRLDELKDLGVTILWIMPIHPIGQEKKKGTVGSPYAVRDFYAIEPAYGSKDDLHRLVSEAHRRGLKVILDIVANHTAWDSVMMAHPDYYTRDRNGKILPPNPDWSDVADLNYDNPALRRYMTDVMRFWLKEFDLDGLRCDVAMEVPTDFWEAARAELETIQPDLFLLAEASKPELLAKAFDVDYAWPFHGTLSEVMSSGRPAIAIRDVWKGERVQFPRGALHMRFSDNHDERRAIARFGERGALAASALIFTMDGVPLLYNGMEAGDTTESGAPALFEKLPIFWQNAERRPEFPRFYQRMIALRRAHPALRRGTTHWISNTDEERIVSFVRQTEDEELLVAVNLSNRPFKGRLRLEGPKAEYQDLTPRLGTIPTDAVHASLTDQALPEIALEAWGFLVLQHLAQ